MILPKKPQILYAPMLATFGGGSVRAFRSAATGPVPADFFENGALTNTNHWQQKTGTGGVNSFTFSNLSGLFSTYKHLMFYATGPCAGEVIMVEAVEQEQPVLLSGLHQISPILVR